METIEIKPEDTLLARAWLIKNGWEPCKDYPLFNGDGEHLDTDLCVVLTRKMYMVANFHHMGDNATLPEAMPSSIEVVGINNTVEMNELNHALLIAAVAICDIGNFDVINKAIGGKYDIIIIKKKERKDAKEL
jgi:hypothetical protein